jgi:hypothetical protein
MRTFRIRATGDVLNTAHATRKHQLDGEVLVTFGREAVYIEADELPSELINDNYLRIDTVDAAHRPDIHPGQAADAGDTPELKSSWVQEPTEANDPGAVAELKSSWVQEPSADGGPNDTGKPKANRKRP